MLSITTPEIQGFKESEPFSKVKKPIVHMSNKRADLIQYNYLSLIFIKDLISQDTEKEGFSH